MNSNSLTKAQVAGIITTELKSTNLYFQAMVLVLIIQTILNFFLPMEYLLLLNLGLILVQGFILYLSYKSLSAKINEFREKYEVA